MPYKRRNEIGELNVPVDPFLVNDKLNVVVVCRAGNSQNMLNVLNYNVGTISGTGASMASLAVGISDKLAPSYKAYLPTTSRYEGVLVTRWQIIPGAAVPSSSGNGPGSSAGDALAPQLSTLISLRSSVAPAGVRGRIYLPAGIESYEGIDGRVSAAGVTEATNVATVLKQLTAVNCGVATTCTLDLQIRHMFVGTPLWYPVTSSITRGAFATQRRRSLINRGDANPF